jgi:hypothetical protein
MTADIAAETHDEGDLETSIETTAEPPALYTAYFSAVEELVEHIRAADLLNLGFRIDSYLVSSDDAPDATQPEYEFTLLSELPLRSEDRN